MIIQCEHCSAKFRIDDAKLDKGSIKVRCSKCKEVFAVHKPADAPEPVPVAPAAAEVAAPVPPPSFDLPTDESASLPGSGDFDSNDFDFGQESPSSGETDNLSDFDWKEAAAPVPDPGPAEFDLASMNSAQVAVDTSGAVDGGGDFDFGDIGFAVDTGSPDRQGADQVPDQSPDDFPLDFGAGTFAEDAAEKTVVWNPAAAAGERSEPAVASASPGAAETRQGGAVDEGVNFGDFDFGDYGAAAPAVQAEAVKQTEAPRPAVPVPVPVPEFDEESPQEEEFPPQAPVSRKRSGGFFPQALIFGAILMVIVLVGAGVYLVSGPEAFSKIGLGFIVDKYGAKGKDEGSISLKDIRAEYVVNKDAGELFVVRGQAVNNFKKPRASIQVKVGVLGKGGAPLLAKTAFCGNALTNEQLASMPLAKIDEITANQFGDSLANLGVKPGAAIQFVVVLSGVPQDASDYSVQVAGSTVATQ
jgi:predicted Zn finger-like uncharacterized protein